MTFYRSRFASDYLNKLKDPKYLEHIIKEQPKKPYSILMGILGAIEKGGRTVNDNPSSVGLAQYYYGILQNRTLDKLKTHDYKKLSGLLNHSFIDPA